MATVNLDDDCSPMHQSQELAAGGNRNGFRLIKRSADETPQEWYFACCSAPEPSMSMYMSLYAQPFHAKIEIASRISMA